MLLFPLGSLRLERNTRTCSAGCTCRPFASELPRPQRAAVQASPVPRHAHARSGRDGSNLLQRPAWKRAMRQSVFPVYAGPLRDQALRHLQSRTGQYRKTGQARIPAIHHPPKRVNPRHREPSPEKAGEIPLDARLASITRQGADAKGQTAKKSRPFRRRRVAASGADDAGDVELQARTHGRGHRNALDIGALGAGRASPWRPNRRRP